MTSSRIVPARVFPSLLIAVLAAITLQCGGDGGPLPPPDEPSITLSSASVTFNGAQGGSDPAAQTVSVGNGGGGTLSELTTSVSYTSGQPTGWLGAALSASTAPSTLTLTPTTGSLTEGTYSASVAVTSAAASNSPRFLNVTFTVTAPPPEAPSGLTATPVASSQIDLAWTDNASDEDGFSLEQCTGVGCTSFVEITLGPNVTSYQSTGLSAETSYSYRVRASNSMGNSAYSNTASATTPPTMPPPTNLTATAVSSSQIDLTWTDNASNEDGYKIERCAGASCTDFTHFTTVPRNFPRFPDTGLSAGTSYSYRVRGSNDAGNSAYSNIASATTLTASEASRTFLASFDNMVINNTSDPNTADRVSETAELDVGSRYFYRTGGEYTALQYASLMKFDVQSEIAGKTILEATLTLHQFLVPADLGGQFRLAAITTSWTPSTITWRTWSGMQFYPDGHLNFAALPSVDAPLEFDVTGIVQNWANGTFANNGFQIWEPNPVPPGRDSDQALAIQSLEVHRGEGNRPQLFIHYR